MATLKELLGESYKEGMTFEEAEAALKSCNLADLNKGEYVSKLKYTADTKALTELAEKAKTDAKAEYEQKLETERTAAKRKRAREKAYDGLSDEQKGLFDALLKDDELKLSDDGESFSNFEEVTKGIKEKYKSLFPKDDGSNNKGGLPPAKGQEPSKFDEFKDYVNLK